MRRALISDIHGNLEALEVVLDDIKSQGITEIFCLGDIIGYGPNPRECIDRVMENCKVTLLGNHDQGAMFDPDGFNIGAERAIFWTREQLENSGRPGEQRAALGVPGRAAPDASDRSVPVRPRLAPQPAERVHLPRGYLQSSQDGAAVPARGPYCFQGHTHVPGIFTESFQFFSPEEIDQEYTLGEGKLMVNVGSVGQPRDGDNRACYVIFEDGLADDAGRRRRRGRHAGRAAEDHLSPAAVRLRDDDPEDLLDSRAGTVPGRSAPTGAIGSCAASRRPCDPSRRRLRPCPIRRPADVSRLPSPRRRLGTRSVEDVHPAIDTGRIDDPTPRDSHDRLSGIVRIGSAAPILGAPVPGLPPS